MARGASGLLLALWCAALAALPACVAESTCGDVKAAYKSSGCCRGAPTAQGAACPAGCGGYQFRYYSDDVDYNSDSSIREKFRGFMEWNQGDKQMFSCFDANWMPPFDATGWKPKLPCAMARYHIYPSTDPLSVSEYVHALQQKWNQASDPIAASNELEPEDANSTVAGAVISKRIYVSKPIGDGDAIERLTLVYLSKGGPPGWNWLEGQWMILPNSNGTYSTPGQLRPISFVHMSVPP